MVSSTVTAPEVTSSDVSTWFPVNIALSTLGCCVAMSALANRWSCMNTAGAILTVPVNTSGALNVSSSKTVSDGTSAGLPL